MRFIRVFTVILLLGLLMAPVFEANPGGNGDSTRDFACGGACHADPDLSAPSSAQIVLVADRNETFVGGPLTVTATITVLEHDRETPAQRRAAHAAARLAEAESAIATRSSSRALLQHAAVVAEARRSAGIPSQAAGCADDPGKIS